MLEWDMVALTGCSKRDEFEKLEKGISVCGPRWRADLQHAAGQAPQAEPAAPWRQLRSWAMDEK